MRTLLSLIFAVLLVPSYAVDKKPFVEFATKALERSQLTVPGSKPFHVKIKIVETTNPDSDYKAEIEQYWLAPDKWLRTIKSPEFSQTLIVNGSETFEQDEGDYLPLWLENLLTAALNPLPMMAEMKNIDAQLTVPTDSKAISCLRMTTRLGTPPVQHDGFVVICFRGPQGLLESVSVPGYSAQFEDYKSFGEKQIARRISNSPEPGTHLRAEITDLTQVTAMDAKLFEITRSTPATEQIHAVRISDSDAKRLALTPQDILWPTVRSGNTKGFVSVIVSVDREGHVRETWPLNSDNAGLEDAVRKQIENWQFKPAMMGGAHVQFNTVLTFEFNTSIVDPLPFLNDSEARALAISSPDVRLRPGLTWPKKSFTIRIAVGEDGTVRGFESAEKLSTQMILALHEALQQWRFKPLIRDGKPQYFHAEIKLLVR